MNVGTFGCIMCMRRNGQAVEQISDLAGIQKSSDDGICFISFYVFNGRHTSFGGFFGKWFIFLAAIEAQLYI